MGSGCVRSVNCWLGPGHTRACRNREGELIPKGTRYWTPQAVAFRASPGAEIRGSIETEFEIEDRDALLELVNEAERLEPYLTYYLWNEKAHDLRRSPNPAVFFRACLANHGLEVS